MVARLFLVGLILSSDPLATVDDAGPLTQSSVDELLAVILDRTLTIKEYLPSRGLLPSKGTILVREEIEGSRFVVTKRALKEPGPWSIRPYRRLQQQADTTRKSVYFVIVDAIVINQDRAVLKVGVDITSPPPDDPKLVSIQTCCCWGTDHYQRDNTGRWRFLKRDNVKCY